MTSDGGYTKHRGTRRLPPSRALTAARRLVVTLGLLLLAGGPAWAGFDDGMAAVKRNDYHAAYEIWLSLAERGDIRAQYNLGVLYDRGRGVPQNFAQAARWYLAAAEQGHLDAQVTLGFAYEKGRGVARDLGEAAKWYRAAAERGDIAAQANLGSFYANGWGVPQDYVQAHKWLNLAASRAKGRKFRRRLVQKRKIVAARLNPEQIAEAQRLAQEWRPKNP